MKKERICRTCRHFEQRGTEDSGLILPDGSAAWVYNVGQCMNGDSVHGGWDAVPGKRKVGGRPDMADWVSCEHWRRRTP
jgi:hypothetical protein